MSEASGSTEALARALAGVAKPDAVVRAALLDSLGEAVIATDLAGRILYWNDAATRLYGWEGDEVIGADITTVVPAAGMEDEAATILDLLRTGRSWSGEFLVRHRDGRSFPALITDTPIQDEDGRLVGIVGISRDITNQRQAEAALRESEQRLDLVRQAATSVLWEWDPTTRLIHWSGPVAEMFGYHQRDIEPSGAWWEARIHPEDRRRVVDGFDAWVVDGGRFWSEEYRFRTVERGYATVFDRAFAARDEAGTLIRVVGAIVDVTERRRLHEAQRFLSQSSMILDLSLDYEATLPTIARLAVHSIADYCLVHVPAAPGSPAFTTAAHADPRQQGLAEELADHLASGAPTDSPAERVLRTGEPVLVPHLDEPLMGLASEPRLTRLSARLGPRSAIFVPLRARRRVVGFLHFARTSPGLPYDAEDLGVAEELARRVGVAVDHARLFESAALANRAKSDFLAVISHELRTPLTAVMGYADLLEAEVAGPLNETQRRQVSRIRAGSERLHRLLEGILAYARLETGHDRPQLATVPIDALLERVEEIIRPRAAEKGVGFVIERREGPATLRTDPDKCMQILLSLLSNAVKFTEASGQVGLRISTDERSVHFDISDTGTGIAEEHLPHVFNPFWQAEQPATRRAGGAGIGLSVARRLARLLGGDVEVAETSPTGSTFRCRIPHAPVH